jgi:UDPglucose 6-dehydrogenase
VAVLGLAFKPGTDDIRDSPALAVATALHQLGAVVTALDPVAMDRARAQYPGLGYAPSAVEAARDAEVLLVLTEWRQFAVADPAELAAVMAKRNVVDGRHALERAQWQEAGWRYRTLGSRGREDQPSVRHLAVSQRSMQASSSSVSTGLVT